MNRRQIFVLAPLAAFMASTAFGYTLLSPRRTWDSAPNFIVDSRGWTSSPDGSLGRSAARNAILVW
ncbi:MAG TPA: hypothetical protein VG477_16050, partial [Thermoanaerobaculia bacterium]|nr:hypothetical protein [Thermoanaerobaculia bacterium]